jgi:hypothetical protein
MQVPVALPIEQQGYEVVDTFSDSSLHSRWTKTEGGSGTIVETANGLEMTVPSAETEQCYVDMTLPEGMHCRSWSAQVHITVEHTGTLTYTIYSGLRILGLGNNTSKAMRGYYYYSDYSGGRWDLGKADSSSAEGDPIGSGEMWIRFRRFDDQIRLDYYNGPYTTDPDIGGYWQEYNTTLAIYQTPRSGTWNFPVLYETLRLEAYQWNNNPGMKVTFRKFKLKIF